MKETIGNVLLNLDYYDGEDAYSDGSIEDRLLEIVPQAVTLIKELAEKWMERQEAQSVQEEEDWGGETPYTDYSSYTE